MVLSRICQTVNGFCQFILTFAQIAAEFRNFSVFVFAQFDDLRVEPEKQPTQAVVERTANKEIGPITICKMRVWSQTCDSKFLFEFRVPSALPW